MEFKSLPRSCTDCKYFEPLGLGTVGKCEKLNDVVAWNAALFCTEGEEKDAIHKT